MFDSEGIDQAIYIVAKHKVIFLSEERHQLLMTPLKQRNLNIFSRRFHCLSVDPSNSALLGQLQITNKIVQFILCENVSLLRRRPTMGDMWFSRHWWLRRTQGWLAFILVI
jgi:hypothetical protein